MAWSQAAPAASVSNGNRHADDVETGERAA